jgi:hypothetical protein
MKRVLTILAGVSAFAVFPLYADYTLMTEESGNTVFTHPFRDVYQKSIEQRDNELHSVKSCLCSDARLVSSFGPHGI